MTSPRIVCLLTLLLCPSLATAQQPPARPAAETRAMAPELKLVAEGWTLLGKGDLAGAADRAAAAAKASPRGIAALTLGLEVAMARTNALAGLDYYEAWLGKRTMEEPVVVRRVAEALLREEADPSGEPAARLEALRALADDGDTRAAAELARGAGSGIIAEHVSAARGDEKAVAALVERLAGNADVRTIDALGRSRRPEAADAIAPLLADPRQEIRGAAADALGRLGTPQATAQLMPLLADRSLWVRAKAAGALYRLGDNSGQAVLQELAADAAPETRLVAAEAMAVRPDEAFMALARELAGSPSLHVRAAAAQLIAPHDPAFARAVLEPLLGNESGAIRELATQGLGEIVTNDFALLRRLMRGPARLTKVRGAARVLALTR